jgi:hypothetical protein
MAKKHKKTRSPKAVARIFTQRLSYSALILACSSHQLPPAVRSECEGRYGRELRALAMAEGHRMALANDYAQGLAAGLKPFECARAMGVEPSEMLGLEALLESRGFIKDQDACEPVVIPLAAE